MSIFLAKKENNKLEDFTFTFIKILKKSVNCYAEMVDQIAELQNNFKEEYIKFKDFQKSPQEFLEMIVNLDESEAKNAFMFFKIIIRFSTIEQKLRNLWFLDSKEQKKLAQKIRDLTVEIENFAKKIKEERNVTC